MLKLNYRTIALIWHTSKVTRKILQARLQQYMNQDLPGVQTGFRKGRGTRDQIANIHWIIKKARGFQKNIYFCFIDYSFCSQHGRMSTAEGRFWMNRTHQNFLACHLAIQFSSVQSLSRVQLFVTPWIAACQASLSSTNSRSSLRLTSIESVMLSSHLILCRPLLLLPPVLPSIKVRSFKRHLQGFTWWSSG